MDHDIFQFRIKGFTRETLPMARLAAYMTELAALFGAKGSVHFDRLLKGSVVLQAKVESTEEEVVVKRLQLVKGEGAPEDALRAYTRLDSMLRENQASGEIRRRGGTKILDFPGKRIPVSKTIEMTDLAEVDGMVVRVGGIDSTIPVHVQSESGEVYFCNTRDRAVAKSLALLIYGEQIRVRGMGQWQRAGDGTWKLLQMTIEAWDRLDQAPLEEMFRDLRSVEGNGWKSVKDIDRELTRIRDGS